LQCSKLWQVIAFSNGLSGDLVALANLKNSLTWLDIGVNNFSREIPINLGNLTLFAHLALNANNLSGEILPIWETLFLLTFLDLNVNHLSGPIPLEIANLEQLSRLYLH